MGGTDSPIHAWQDHAISSVRRPKRVIQLWSGNARNWALWHRYLGPRA